MIGRPTIKRALPFHPEKVQANYVPKTAIAGGRQALGQKIWCK